MSLEMTLFFHWNNLRKETKGDPLKTVEILKSLYYGKIMKYGLRQRLVGNSFLLNAEALLNDKTTDILYIYQYLLLASRRNYTDYTIHGSKVLPLTFYPDISVSLIRTNPLLTIKNNEIHFKYEE